MKTFITAIALFTASITSGYSKAYFQTESELVTKATAIAIIEVSEPKPSEQKGATWTYRQSAIVKVTQRLKGDLPETFTIYGGETFICAQCGLAAGRYLAFLRRDGDLWVGSNWHLSLRPIKDDQIEWYAKADQRHPLKFQPSETVLKRIRDIMAAPKTP